ncbi:MAG TPA: HAD family hydrolase [Acidimicrobiales bacterium]|nr:HAD family hydrolase [Acidimicrobiales bacterium]
MTTKPGDIQAVIFDWGGTLSVFAAVELADMWRLAARHLASHGALRDPRTEERIARELARVEAAAWDRVSDDQSPSTLGEILADASAALGMDVAEAVLEEAATHHLDSWTPHIEHDPDAAPVLRELRERGLRTGLLSNTHWPRAFHEHFLERDGLAALLDTRCYTSEMKRTKPHADAFAHALNALDQHDPSRVVFVGDRPYDDIYGAQQFGMKAVLRPNPNVPSWNVTPDATIESLTELPSLIDIWNAPD